MRYQVLDNHDITHIDRLLIKDGLVRPIHYKRLKLINPNEIKFWLTQHGVYQVPTWELIEWLKFVIDGRMTIEIGAGKACIGRHVGVRLTDSCICEVPLVEQYYRALGQPITIPPTDVERISGNDAIIKYRPQVVLGSWITQWSNIPHDGNFFGVNEERILDAGATYILVGNIDVHGQKRIMRWPHREYYFPWLVSRGMNQSNNRIWIWNAR